MPIRTTLKVTLLAAAFIVAAPPSEAASLLDILIPHAKAPAHRARGRLPSRHRPAPAAPTEAVTPPRPSDNPMRESPPMPNPRPGAEEAGLDEDSWATASAMGLAVILEPSAPFSSPSSDVLDATGLVVIPGTTVSADAPPLPGRRPAPSAADSPSTAMRSAGPDEAEIAACRAGLARLDVVAEAEPPFFEGICGAEDPSLVKALQSGAVELEPPARIDCRVATALAQWIAEDVQPAARATYGEGVTRIRIAGSYVCRSRNHVEGATLSEHAFMNAVDIGTIEIGKRKIAIADDPERSPIDATFLADLRKTACTRFTTVLGPGSDADHKDHLHLDMIRRGRNGDGRICQ